MSMLGGGYNPVAGLLQGFGQRPADAPQQQQPTPGKIIWEFPSKGKFTNCSYRLQPPGTCPDMLNALVYDPTTNRPRGGQRMGTNKVFSLAQGNGSGTLQPVQVMGCHTFELVENVLVDDNFNYQHGNLQTVSGEYYSNIIGSPSFGDPINGSGGTEVMMLFSNFSTTSGATVINGGISIGTQAKTQQWININSTVSPNVGSIFSVSVTITPPSDSISLASHQYFAVMSRESFESYSDVGQGEAGTMAYMHISPQPGIISFWLVDVMPNGSNDRSENILASATFTSLTTLGMAMGTAAIIEVNINGNLVSLIVNGVTILQGQTGVVVQGPITLGASFQHLTDTTSAGFTISNLTISTNATTSLGNTTVFNDLFQYAGSSQLSTQNTLWVTSINGPIGHAGNGNTGVTSSFAWLTTGSNVQATNAYGGTFQNFGAYAIYNSSLSIRRLASYVVSTTFQYGNGTGGQADWGYFYQLLKFGNPNSSNGGTGLYVQFKCDNTGTPACTLGLLDDTGKVWQTATALPIGTFGTGPSTPITLSTNVNGSVFTAFVNGAEAWTVNCPYNYAVNNANKVGFGYGANNTATATVLQFNVANNNSQSAIRSTELVTITNGNVYICQPITYNASPSYQLVTGGSNAINPNVVPQMCFADSYCFIVDGTNEVYIDLSQNTLNPVTGTSNLGGIPPFPSPNPPANMQLCCIWRGSLVLARQTGQEQYWIISRIGIYSDFNLSASPTDGARSVDGSSGQSYGNIGDEIVALIPLNDDILLFGCVNQIYAFVGDPRYNGVIDHFIRESGILGPDAWAFDTIGTLYWLGPAGLFRLAKGYTIPQNLSREVIPDYFANISRATNTINLEWYEDLHQLHIYITPTVATGTPGIHMFWDERTGAFQPIQWGQDNHGPVSVLFYDGDTVQDRAVLLGGRDGYIRRYQGSANTVNAAWDDDGTAIGSYVYLTPQRPIDDVTEAKVESIDLYLGNDQVLPNGIGYDMYANLQAAPDIQDAINNPTVAIPLTGSPFQANGHIKTRDRMRGGAFTMKLGNSQIDKTWSLERIVLTIKPGAPQR